MTALASQGNAASGVPSRFFTGRFLIAVVILFVTACSSSAPNAGSSAATSAAPAAAVPGGLPEPCSLVTQAEVETALGKGATKTSIYNERLGAQQCRLKPATAGTIDVIVMGVHKADLWDGIKKAMLPPGSDAKPVPGLGDDAFVGRAVGYNVRKGDKYVQIFGAVTNNDAANEKATRYLAERASSRL
jgi:hypothetical protein